MPPRPVSDLSTRYLVDRIRFYASCPRCGRHPRAREIKTEAARRGYVASCPGVTLDELGREVLRVSVQGPHGPLPVRTVLVVG